MASHHALVATANGSGLASALARQSGSSGKASSSSKKKKKPAPSWGNTAASNTATGQGFGGGNVSRPRFPNTPWASGYNPWTDMVQALPMLFHHPGAGVLGPRPGSVDAH